MMDRTEPAPRKIHRQLIVDVVFGILLPPLCLVFDPGIFRTDVTIGWMTQFQLFAYLAIPEGIIALALWLRFGTTLISWAELIGGILLIGAVLSLALGIAMLPVTILGICFMGLGLLGFAPFFSAFVYWRNARKALRLVNVRLRPRRSAALVFLSVLLVIGLPGLLQIGVNWKVSQALDQIASGSDMAAMRATAQELTSAIWCLDYCLDQMAWLDKGLNSGARRDLLEQTYEARTGKKIYARLPRLFDD